MRDTIDMAREAGWEMDDSFVLEPEVIWYVSQGQLERFEALVRADEREACIQVIKKTQFSNWFQADCIEAIRARGNT